MLFLKKDIRHAGYKTTNIFEKHILVIYSHKSIYDTGFMRITMFYATVSESQVTFVLTHA